MADELETNLKQAQEAEQKGDFFSAAHFYKVALNIAKNLNDSEKIKFIKPKLLEASQKSTSQFKTISVEQKIPTEEIDDFIGKLLPHELDAIFYVIGMSKNFCPLSDRIKETANKSVPIAYHIANVSIISDTGHLISGSDDPQKHWYWQTYGFSQEIMTNLLLCKVFYQLQESGRLTKDSLLKFIASMGLIPDDQLKILNVALERYFAKDFVSALHILIPQFESFFLAASEKFGIDIISLNRTKEISTQPRTLGQAHLDTAEFQEVWGKDLCEQIKFILFEPLGYKLRHRIAHGEIKFGESNYQTTTLMIYLFLTVCSRRIKQLADAEAKKD